MGGGATSDCQETSGRALGVLTIFAYGWVMASLVRGCEHGDCLLMAH